MPYSQFSVEQIKTNFGITLTRTVDLFANIPEIEPSNFLKETLQFNLPLALEINSEKARYLNKFYRVLSKARMYYLSCGGKSQAKIVINILCSTKPSHESTAEPV
ncbi:MAG: hypothetical protein EAZ09_04720 [Oscillatoriales cyanobacterium]|nr:MAG: hypothetical protein EAZ18_02955 [Oscillatoriales cyanobacterium]TAH24154.1 MAG: hypothetical protein EAZ09_04720 [Oscillatoriales cyanobacterium]